MRRLGFVLIALCATAVPTPAFGASVDVTRSTWFVDDEGERNDVTVALSADKRVVLFVDRSSRLEARSGCTGGGAPGKRVRCNVEAINDVSLRMALGGGNDSVTTTRVERGVFGAGSIYDDDLIVYGEGGDDRIVTGPTDDLMLGGTGDDVARGGSGKDEFRIGSGSDGDDVVDGGGGHSDRISFASSNAPIRVTLAGGDDDGRPGERDDIQAFEGVEGGSGDDRLVGTQGSEGLFGNDGDDYLAGLEGRDILVGGGGGDRAEGGSGPDSLRADQGRKPSRPDRYSGGSGDDSITGGLGDDRLAGGSGDDAIAGLRGEDLMSGGPGKDRLDGVRTQLNSRSDSASDRIRCGEDRDVAVYERGRDRLTGCEQERPGRR